jgi:cation diffusion facilitator CzcD-associated flavoprotein CzcO
VIGIGASAIQFVPQVAKVAGSMTLFQRSVNYVAPKPDRRYRPWERWVFDHVGPLRRAYRASIYWRFEARFLLMRKNNRVGGMLRERFAKKIGVLVSDRLPAEALVPNETPGCRRILIANDWYPTLLRPNVEVVTDDVAEVTDQAVRTADGREFPVDTIIFGTGFRSTEFLSPLRITGRDGVRLDDVWADGARAYLGLAVPSFPNLFMLYGPNTNLGHNSILFMVEQQVGFVRSLLEDLGRRGLAVAEVTPAAMERYDLEMLRATQRTVWAEDCHSWYKTASGRITNNWPDFTFRYRRRLAHRQDRDLRLSTGPDPARVSR